MLRNENVVEKIFEDAGEQGFGPDRDPDHALDHVRAVHGQ